MAENTKIQWAHHTFNPWIGCTRVSPACDNCYAAVSTPARTRALKWVSGEPRQRTKESTWQQPLRWNRKAEREGARYRVFCASLADVFDTEVDNDWRFQLFDLILRTPNLDWLLLTKRPSVARDWFRARGMEWSNVWLGTTVENQDMAEARVPWLLETPGVKYRFLSMEPLLGPVDLTPYLWGRSFDPCERCPQDSDCEAAIFSRNSIASSPGHPCSGVNAIDWVIVGGESGPNARNMASFWAGDILEQCLNTAYFEDGYETPFFMKQMSGTTKAQLEDIPENLMIREFPDE